MQTLTHRLTCLAAAAGLFLAATATRAQGPGATDHDQFETRKQLTVGVTKFAEARTALNAFIGARAAQVLKQEETPERLTADFILPVRDLRRLDSLAAVVGYVTESNLNAHNLDVRRQELAAEQQTTREQLARTEQALQTAPTEPERQNLRAQADRQTASLRQLEQREQALARHAGQAYVTLRVYDEVTFPTGNRKISFVNMPGVEYAYLRLDNPKPGLTSAAYQGYALKYLFTRGKSYFNLGVYKPTTPNRTDEDFVNELFVLNFGQDFYPRNFGRGRRKYLNLYTSYQIGGFILSRNRDEQNDFIPNLNLGLGVELLKTRHVLLDTKGSYFVPLDRRSRDLRGVLGQASFSFVF